MTAKHTGTRPLPVRREAGFSLVEGIMAAALLLVVAVAVLPIFVRALDSNLSGGRSSQLSTFASGDLEAVNQGPVDQEAWSVDAAPGGVLALASRYWDAGDHSVPDALGDEKWVDAVADADGMILWQRDASVRKYSLADIQILIGTGGGLASGGSSPQLFDNPLANDDDAHLTELRVTVKENRESLPAASGKRITVSHFRAF